MVCTRIKGFDLTLGFGHATRVCQVTQELAARNHTVHIITNAPEHIFASVIRQGAKYRKAPIDAGVIQPKAYTVDIEQTIAGLQTFLDSREEKLRIETEFLQSVRADCVLSDAPFLPCAAAAAVGIPSAIISNFTFDTVYSYLCTLRHVDGEANAHLMSLVAKVIKDYRNAALLLRLPGYIPLPAFDEVELPSVRWTDDNDHPAKKRRIIAGRDTRFPRRVVDTQLVVRKARTSKEQVLASVGITPEIASGNKILLVSFGGQNLRENKWDNALPQGWIAIVCGLAAGSPSALPSRFYASDRDAYVPDLTNAADVVLGKLGYGTCSECIGHSKPFVYVPRPQFVEEYGLRRLMQEQGSCVEMSMHEFEDGKWAEKINLAASLPGCRKGEGKLRHDGGLMCAIELERYMAEIL